MDNRSLTASNSRVRVTTSIACEMTKESFTNLICFEYNSLLLVATTSCRCRDSCVAHGRSPMRKTILAGAFALTLMGSPLSAGELGSDATRSAPAVFVVTEGQMAQFKAVLNLTPEQ